MGESATEYKIIHIENTLKNVKELNIYIQPEILDDKDVNLDALNYLASVVDIIRNDSKITEEERKEKLATVYEKILSIFPPRLKAKANRVYSAYKQEQANKEPYFFKPKEKEVEPTSLDFDEAPSFNQKSIDIEDLLEPDYEMPITLEDDFLGPKEPNTFDPSSATHFKR